MPADDVSTATDEENVAVSSQLIAVEANVDTNDPQTSLPLTAENSHGEAVDVSALPKIPPDANSVNKRTQLQWTSPNGRNVTLHAQLPVLIHIKENGTIFATNNQALIVTEDTGNAGKIHEAANFLRAVATVRDFNVARDGNVDTVQRLLSLKCSVEWCTAAGRTPLMEAVFADDAGAAQVLIDAKANAAVRNTGNDTPLMCALQRGHQPTIKVLINAIAAEDVHGVLLDIAQRGDTAMLRRLLEANVCLDVRDDNQHTPLMKAAFQGHTVAVGVLVRPGAQLDLVDEKGDTALMLAARHDHADAVKCLVDANASITIANKVGKTVLDVAVA